MIKMTLSHIESCKQQIYKLGGDFDLAKFKKDLILVIGTEFGVLELGGIVFPAIALRQCVITIEETWPEVSDD